MNRMTYRFLHPGHCTITIPFVYALLVNVCDDLCPHSGTVHVNVKDSLGSSGFSNASLSVDWDDSGGGSAAASRDRAEE